MSTSSISAASSTSGANKLRITGMASGLDIDATIKKMMAAEQAKVDKAQQDEDIIKWKQEMYQDVIKDIKDLQNSFFDTASADKNILSSSNYSGFEVTGGTSSVASITAGVGAQVGSYKVNVGASGLASKASTIGGNIVNNTSNGYTAANWSGKDIGFIIDGGTPQKITLNANTSITDTVTDINSKINLNTTLKGKVQAIVSGGKIQFQTLSNSSVKIDNNVANTTVTTDLDNLKDKFITNSSVSTTLKNLGLSDADASDSFQITYNGTTKTISVKNTDKLSDIINNISTTTSGDLTASFSQLTGKFMIQSTNTGSSQNIAISNGTGTSAGKGKALAALGIGVDSSDGYTDGNWQNNKIGFVIDGGATKTITLDNTVKTLADRVADINTKITSAGLDAKVKAVVSGGNIQFQSLSNSSVKIADTADTTVVNDLKSLKNQVIQKITLGTDATVTITPPGGTATTITKSTNNFTIDGISYNLTGEGDSTVTVASTATDKVYDKIKTFIDKYNTIVDKIQTKLLEKKSSTYKPLTEVQKESMTDAQIASWETKGKVGLLRNDQNLQNMLSGLKSAFTTGVSGVGLAIGKYGATSIGLDTSTDYSKPAHVDITDSSKLKAAISTNGEQILKMFANVSASTDKNTKYNENGIFARIKNIFEENVGFTNTTLNTATLTKYANKQDDFSMTGTSGNNTLPNQIYHKELLIKKMKETLRDREEAYYQKFSKLETAMNTLNSQQSFISQQFS